MYREKRLNPRWFGTRQQVSYLGYICPGLTDSPLEYILHLLIWSCDSQQSDQVVPAHIKATHILQYLGKTHASGFVALMCAGNKTPAITQVIHIHTFLTLAIPSPHRVGVGDGTPTWDTHLPFILEVQFLHLFLCQALHTGW